MKITNPKSKLYLVFALLFTIPAQGQIILDGGGFVPPADTDPPSVPTNVNLVVISDDSLLGYWTNPPENDFAKNYILRDNSVVDSTVNDSFYMGGFLPNSHHYIQVRSRDESYNYSAYSDTVGATTLDTTTSQSTAPLIPTALTVTDSVDGIDLAWVNNPPNATRIIIRRDNVDYDTVNYPTSTWTDPDLTEGIYYDYKIYAENSGGSSDTTAEVTAERVGSNTYYISLTSGNDAKTGTNPNLSWKTLAKLQAFLSTSTISPGTKFRLKRGDTWTGTYPTGSTVLALQGIHGTSANPIVLDAYGIGEKPIINITGQNTRIINITGGSSSLVSYYFEINNLQLISTATITARPTYAIRLAKSGTTSISPHHLTFDGLVIDGTQVGILTNSINEYITVTNCTIQNTIGGEGGGSEGAGEAIKGVGKGNQYTNNTFTNNGWEDEPNGRGATLYLSSGGSDSSVVKNNIFMNGKTGIVLANGHSCYIEDNQFINFSAVGIGASSRAQGTGYLTYLYNTFIHRNYFENCAYGIAVTQTVTNNPETGNTYTIGLEIVNNLFVDGYSAIRFLESTANPDPVYFQDILVANNTIVNFRLGGIYVQSGNFSDASTEIKNNIFYNTEYSSGYLIDVSSSSNIPYISFDYNLYYATVGSDTRVGGTVRTLADFQSTYTSDEQNSFTGNPLFVTPITDFHLQAGSPAINAGVNLAAVTDDYDGNARANPPEIGAYEYVP